MINIEIIYHESIFKQVFNMMVQIFSRLKPFERFILNKCVFARYFVNLISRSLSDPADSAY